MISLPHPVRVFLHTPPTDLRKGFDQGQVSLHLGAADSHDLAVDENVLAAGELGIEASAQFQKRGYASARYYAARGRLKDTTDYLEQRALAATVRSHQTDHLAAVNAERDIPQCPEIRVQRLAAKGIQLSDAVKRRLIELVAFRDVLDEQQTTSVAAYYRNDASYTGMDLPCDRRIRGHAGVRC